MEVIGVPASVLKQNRPRSREADRGTATRQKRMAIIGWQCIEIGAQARHDAGPRLVQHIDVSAEEIARGLGAILKALPQGLTSIPMRTAQILLESS